MLRLIPMDCGLLEAPSADTVTLPSYVPGRMPGSVLTPKVAGVVPLAGNTVSQFPPEVVLAVALKLRDKALVVTDKG